MIKAVLLFILGFVLLIKGGDWFVDGATDIAHKFRLPEILIGATVVSIGTTLPELMVSAGSAVAGHGEIAYGNAIGTIICNTALVCAITIALKPGEVDRQALKIPVGFFFGSAVFYSINAYMFRTYSRISGIILLLIFGVYMIINVRQAMASYKAQMPSAAAVSEDQKPEEEKEVNIGKAILLLLIGAACIAVGADLLIDNGIIIAQVLGVPESVIALTIVAFGTSLPELVTAITSISKGHGALSLGNVIGANLFNMVLVSGAAITLSPFDLPSSKTVMGYNSSLVVDIPLMFITMLILSIPPLIKGRLKRWQGILLLVMYAAFCVYQFVS